MSNTSNQSEDSKMHVEIGHVSASGHVVVAGRDAHVSGNTQGDSAQGQRITIGGVETTAAEAEEMKHAIDNVHMTIEQEPLEPEVREAAEHDAKILQEQMTSPKKPNDYIFSQAAQRLYNYGPKIAGSIVALFTNPLAGVIVATAGERALKLYETWVNGSPPPVSTDE